MSVIVFIFYIGYSIHDVFALKKMGVKKDIYVYISIMLIPLIISILIISGIEVPDPSDYIGRVIGSIQEFIGVKL